MPSQHIAINFTYIAMIPKYIIDSKERIGCGIQVLGFHKVYNLNNWITECMTAARIDNSIESGEDSELQHLLQNHWLDISTTIQYKWCILDLAEFSMVVWPCNGGKFSHSLEWRHIEWTLYKYWSLKLVPKKWHLLLHIPTKSKNAKKKHLHPKMFHWHSSCLKLSLCFQSKLGMAL